TAYLLAIACILVLIASKSRRPGLIPVIISITVAAVPLVLLNFANLTGWLPSDVSTLTGRTTIWAASLEAFKMYPVFGYGPTLLNEDFRARWLGDFSAAGQAHNQLFQDLGG